MSLLKIEVRNSNSQKVVYENSFMPVSKYRDYLEMQKDLSGEKFSEAEKLDKQLDFIVSLFPGLKIEDLYNGLEMSELNDIIQKVFLKLVGEDIDPKEQN
ncbi:TPA: hypothetical protein U3L57_000075 [Streptococcus agalactiae]|nr:hypothetical protein [Streptococcus agalactiae]